MQAGLATPASETAPAWMGAVWIAKGQARSRQGCLGRHPDISSMGGVALAHYQSFLLLTHSGYGGIWPGWDGKLLVSLPIRALGHRPIPPHER